MNKEREIALSNIKSNIDELELILQGDYADNLIGLMITMDKLVDLSRVYFNTIVAENKLIPQKPLLILTEAMSAMLREAGSVHIGQSKKNSFKNSEYIITIRQAFKDIEGERNE